MENLRPREVISTLSSESESSSVTSSPAHSQQRWRAPVQSLSGSLNYSESNDANELRGLALNALSCGTILEDDETIKNVTSNLGSLGMRHLDALPDSVKAVPSGGGIAYSERSPDKAKSEAALLDEFPFDSEKMMVSSRLGSERLDDFQIDSGRLPLGSSHHSMVSHSTSTHSHSAHANSFQSFRSSGRTSAHESGHLPRVFSNDKEGEGMSSMRSDAEREMFTEFDINNVDSMRSKDGFSITPQRSGLINGQYDGVFSSSSRSEQLDVQAEKHLLQSFLPGYKDGGTSHNSSGSSGGNNRSHHHGHNVDSMKSVETIGDFSMDISAKSILDSYRSDMSTDTVTRKQLIEFLETTESGKSLEDSAKQMLMDYFDQTESAKSNDSISKKELFDHFENSEHARKMDTHTRNRIFEGFAQFHVGYPHFHISKPSVPSIVPHHNSFSLTSLFHHNNSNESNTSHETSSSAHNSNHRSNENNIHTLNSANIIQHNSNTNPEDYHNSILSGIWMSKQTHDPLPMHDGGTTSEKYHHHPQNGNSNSNSNHNTTATVDSTQGRHRHTSFSGVMPQLWHKKPHQAPGNNGPLSSLPEQNNNNNSNNSNYSHLPSITGSFHNSSNNHMMSSNNVNDIQAALLLVQQQQQHLLYNNNNISNNGNNNQQQQLYDQQQQQQQQQQYQAQNQYNNNTNNTMLGSSSQPTLPYINNNNNINNNPRNLAPITMHSNSTINPTVFNFYTHSATSTLPRTQSAPGSAMMGSYLSSNSSSAMHGNVSSRLPPLTGIIDNNSMTYQHAANNQPPYGMLQQPSPRLLPALHTPQNTSQSLGNLPAAYHTTNTAVYNSNNVHNSSFNSMTSLTSLTSNNNNNNHSTSNSQYPSLNSLTTAADTTTTVTIDPISGALKPIEILKPVIKEKASAGAYSAAQQAAAAQRGQYRCGKCGQPKADHVCKYDAKTFKSRGAQVYHPIYNLASNTPFPGEKFLTIKPRTTIQDTPISNNHNSNSNHHSNGNTTTTNNTSTTMATFPTTFGANSMNNNNNSNNGATTSRGSTPPTGLTLQNMQQYAQQQHNNSNNNTLLHPLLTHNAMMNRTANNNNNSNNNNTTATTNAAVKAMLMMDDGTNTNTNTNGTEEDKYFKSEVTISVHQSTKSSNFNGTDSTKSSTHIDLSEVPMTKSLSNTFNLHPNNNNTNTNLGTDTIGFVQNEDMLADYEAAYYKNNGTGTINLHGIADDYSANMNNGNHGGVNDALLLDEGEDFSGEISSLPQKFVTHSRTNSVKQQQQQQQHGRLLMAVEDEVDDTMIGSDGQTTYDTDHTGKFTPSTSIKTPKTPNSSHPSHSHHNNHHSHGHNGHHNHGHHSQNQNQNHVVTTPKGLFSHH